MRRWVVLLAGCFACGLFGLQAEQGPAVPPATFRSGVDVVDVDVSVLDRDRLPVRGLVAADFTVLEDGRPRPVVAFSAVDLPPRELPSARWMADIAPDVLVNTFPRAGRLVVILMDRTIGLDNLPAAQRFAEAAVDQLRPGDLAAVVYSTFGVPQNFTADRARLLAAIRQPIAGLPEDDDGSPAECLCGTCSLESIAEVAEAMAPVRQRRKMMFVIGANISIQSSGTCGGLLTPVRRRAMRALEAGNVTVHAFDPTGLQTLAPTASSAGLPNSARTVSAALARRGNIGVLPGHTGGRVVGDPIRPADRVAELFRESNSYYVLGFQPAASSVPGRFHSIEVKVARKDVVLQARRGYYAGGGTSHSARATPSVIPATLRSAVEGLWPKTDLALSIVAAPVASPRLDGATVAVVVAANRPSSAEFGTVAAGPLDVFVGAFDRRGQAVAGSRQTVAVTPARPGGDPLAFELLTRLDLRPGRYELRAAVEDVNLSQSGSVYAYVDVPDYRREPVSMSGLVLSLEPSRVMGKPGTDLPWSPSVQRAFARDAHVNGFVRIYQGLGRDLVPGYVVAEILNETDQSVFRQESRVLVEQFGASRAMDFSVDVPIARLVPGQYVLSVEARHGNATARRTARFRVVP